MLKNRATKVVLVAALALTTLTAAHDGSGETHYRSAVGTAENTGCHQFKGNATWLAGAVYNLDRASDEQPVFETRVPLADTNCVLDERYKAVVRAPVGDPVLGDASCPPVVKTADINSLDGVLSFFQLRLDGRFPTAEQQMLRAYRDMPLEGDNGEPIRFICVDVVIIATNTVTTTEEDCTKPDHPLDKEKDKYCREVEGESYQETVLYDAHRWTAQPLDLLDDSGGGWSSGAP